jgi:hypothetical protein
MYVAYFLPKNMIVKKPLIDNNYLGKTMKKYKSDWDEILKYT